MNCFYVFSMNYTRIWCDSDFGKREMPAIKCTAPSPCLVCAIGEALE